MPHLAARCFCFCPGCFLDCCCISRNGSLGVRDLRNVEKIYVARSGVRSGTNIDLLFAIENSSSVSDVSEA